MAEQFLINDPDVVWAEMERLVGIADMQNGERDHFEKLFRNLLAAAYAPKQTLRAKFYSLSAFELHDLIKTY